MAIQQKLGHGVNFWFGHMGYEYVDLGRFWAILLFVGLMIWLTLVGRALWPALKAKNDNRLPRFARLRTAAAPVRETALRNHPIGADRHYYR